MPNINLNIVGVKGYINLNKITSTLVGEKGYTHALIGRMREYNDQLHY